MIIELNGLPGSGKSYFDERLVKELKAKGFFVINLPSSGRGIVERAYRKIMSYLLYFFYSRKDPFKKLVASRKKEKGIYAKNIKFAVYFRRFIYLKVHYSILSKQKKIFIFDEGIIQILAEIVADFKLDKSDVDLLYSQVQTIHEKSISIYYEFPIDGCMQSIKIRNRNVCDIDRLGDEDLTELLKSYQLTYDMFNSEGCKWLKLNRQDLLDDNIKKVIENIKGMKL